MIKSLGVLGGKDVLQVIKRFEHDNGQGIYSGETTVSDAAAEAIRLINSKNP
jgi:hypothetical protein